MPQVRCRTPGGRCFLRPVRHSPRGLGADRNGQQGDPRTPLVGADPSRKGGLGFLPMLRFRFRIVLTSALTVDLLLEVLSLNPRVPRNR